VASLPAGRRSGSGVDLVAGVSKHLGIRSLPAKEELAACASWRFAAALAFAVAMARFPDEPVRLFWPFENAAPYSTLTLVPEDLVDREKVARIEKNESLAVTERWGPDAKLDGRELAAEAWG
jgi:hypothetical protein